MNNLQLIPMIDWLFDEHFSVNNSHLNKVENYRFLSNRIVSTIENDKLEVAISVVGHDPKNVNVELTEDRIFVKAKLDKEDKSVTAHLISDFDEVLKLSKDFNGLSAKATIKDGILHITVDKKEESKPKKISIKF